MILLAGCVTKDYKPTASGWVAADEPRAALIGRAVMASGGNAIDAATAMGTVMAATLPSRVGYGGGGVCLIHDPKTKRVTTLDFLARPGAPGRPLVPGLARGLFALQASGGRLRWERLVTYAETLARGGVPVSRAFARDLAAPGVAARLAADPAARRLFFAADGRPLGEGDRLVQPELASFVAALRDGDAGAVYSGPLAPLLESGLGLTTAELRGYFARDLATVSIALGRDDLHFPVLALSAVDPAATWQTLKDGRDDAWAAHLIAALKARAQSGPASAAAGLIAVDPFEQAVACTFSLGDLFGSGRMVPGTGLFAADGSGEASIGGPVLAVNSAVHTTSLAASGAAIGYGEEGKGAALAAVIAATYHALERERDAGEAVAAGRVALGPGGGVVAEPTLDPAAAAALVPAGGHPQAVSALGRVNLLVCRTSRMTGDKTCTVASDPRGFGMNAEALIPNQ
ncbi:MAG: gamma-glutamyltranspeptidase [Azospirillum sp.]|nr:gamma-glutamyltranspeptidase [Azospirillum sp.]